MMELYLSGNYTNKEKEYLKKYGCLFLLNTFFDMRTWKEEKINELIKIPQKSFMLDSGAFTFMNNGNRVKWKKYVDEYINFINKYDIQNFIELDLYEIIGTEKTEMIRNYIEKKTKKKPIPVYHGTMSIQYYRDLCQNYPYVAISATGTLESSKWVKNIKVLKQVVKIGHNYGTKIHGLGYTRLAELNNPQILFDSIDSTSWLNGCRFGSWYDIKHAKIIQKDYKNMGITRYVFNEHNCKIWIEKQKDLYYNY